MHMFGLRSLGAQCVDGRRRGGHPRNPFDSNTRHSRIRDEHAAHGRLDTPQRNSEDLEPPAHFIHSGIHFEQVHIKSAKPRRIRLP